MKLHQGKVEYLDKNNKTTFIECLYILSKHYKLCTVLSNKRIMWKRVNFKQGKFLKNPISFL